VKTLSVYDADYGM